MANATKPSPIFVAIVGIRFRIPVIITVSPSTIDVAPAVNATLSAEIPAAIRVIPAPIPNVATPNKANAAANPNIDGIIGVNKSPATPITVNAPANVNKLLTIEETDIPPNVFNTGVITDNAAAAISNAAEPANVPFMKFNPMANSANAPPNTVRPLPISVQLIPLKSFIAEAKTFKAAPTTTNPVPINNVLLGIVFIAMTTSAKAPAIVAKPLPISSQLRDPKSFTADAIIFKAAPNKIIEVPVDKICLALPVNLVKAVNSISKPPIDASPLPISLQLRDPKFLTAYERTNNAADKTSIPLAVLPSFLSNEANFRNTNNSAINAPTDTKPFAIPSQPIVDSTFIAEDKIRIATAKLFIKLTAFIVPLKFESIFPNKANDPTNSANKTAIAPNALFNESGSIVEITKIEAANNAIADAIFNNAPAFNCS